MSFRDLPREVRKNRLISLAFSTPYLLLVAPGIIQAASRIPELEASLFFLIEVLFIAAYISVWLTLDVPSHNPRVSRIQLALYSILIALFLMSLPFTAWGTIFNTFYLISALYLTAPQGRLRYALGGAIVVTAGTALYAWRAGVPGPELTGFAIASPIVLIMFVLVRHTLDAGLAQEHQYIADKAHAVETERARMATNLHDRLGQTLTAINTVAQVSTRLARTGQVEAAAERTEQIAELASQALREVRQVVRSDDRLTIAEEIQRAALLLEAADIALHVTVDAAELPAEVEDIFAHVIREGSANIVHHSLASTAVIRVTERGVEIIDSGPAREHSDRSGFGIGALTQTCRKIGSLSAGPAGKGWRLALSADRLDP